MNDRLVIKYDIAGNETGDRFHVWCEITDSAGNKITARSIYGDIGDDVAGGTQKQIIWDLAADSVYLNADINIEVFATRRTKPAPVVVPTVAETRPEMKTDSTVTALKTEKPPELKTDNEVPKKRAEKHPETKTDSVATRQRVEKHPETITDTGLPGKKKELEPEPGADITAPATKKSAPAKKEETRAEKSVKTGSELLLSTVCPGWGLTRLSGGKPYWLLGIVGYGCIGTSYYLNRLSVSNYDKYTNSSDINKTDEMDAYFNTGKNQYTASNILALSAITIWVADLGITWIKASKMKRSAAGVRSGSLSVKSTYDHFAGTPLISILYTF